LPVAKTALLRVFRQALKHPKLSGSVPKIGGADEKIDRTHPDIDRTDLKIGGSDLKIGGRDPKIEKAELLMTRANSRSRKSDFELARLISGSTVPFPGTGKVMPGSTLAMQRSAGAIPESAPEQRRGGLCCIKASP
jgi:hypothetical protein